MVQIFDMSQKVWQTSELRVSDALDISLKCVCFPSELCKRASKRGALEALSLAKLAFNFSLQVCCGGGAGAGRFAKECPSEKLPVPGLQIRVDAFMVAWIFAWEVELEENK